jgi:hypothetical protein
VESHCFNLLIHQISFPVRLEYQPVFSHLTKLVLPRPILITWALLLALAMPISSLIPERLTASATKIRGSQADLVSNMLEDRFGVRPVERTVLASTAPIQTSSGHHPR